MPGPSVLVPDPIGRCVSAAGRSSVASTGGARSRHGCSLWSYSWLLRSRARAFVDHHAQATSTGWKNRRLRRAVSEFKPNAS
jgi:hypothetical protein